jgi:hypothetical protein
MGKRVWGRAWEAASRKRRREREPVTESKGVGEGEQAYTGGMGAGTGSGVPGGSRTPATSRGSAWGEGWPR